MGKSLFYPSRRGGRVTAIDEVGIPVHGEFIWLHFVDNLPSGYELIKSNLHGSKEPLTRTVLEDALRSRYNVTSGEKRGSLDTALFASGSKAVKGGGRGGGHGNSKSKPGSRGQGEGSLKGNPSHKEK